MVPGAGGQNGPAPTLSKGPRLAWPGASIVGHVRAGGAFDVDASHFTFPGPAFVFHSSIDK